MCELTGQQIAVLREGLQKGGNHARRVIDVTKGSPAQQASLQVGDIILKVAGRPADETRLYDLIARLRNDPPGTVVTFLIGERNNAKDVKVTLRDLI